MNPVAYTTNAADSIAFAQDSLVDAIQALKTVIKGNDEDANPEAAEFQRIIELLGAAKAALAAPKKDLKKAAKRIEHRENIRFAD